MQGGIETIPRAIVDKLQGAENIQMNLNSPCDQIEFNGNNAKLSINGKVEESSHVISTLPAFTLAKLLKNQHPSLANELQGIPYVDVAVINLLYAKENLLKDQGFGVLVAPSENLPILGIIFDSCITDSNGNTVLTVMSGGRFFDKYYGQDSSKEFVLKKALEGISKILKIDEKPDAHEVYVHRQCIPQYNVGHHARIERIRKYVAEKNLPLSLGGAAFNGVGVNDVIFASKKIVNALKI
jgi:oxygen-dependent protoporphyrinogen oxidase